MTVIEPNEKNLAFLVRYKAYMSSTRSFLEFYTVSCKLGIFQYNIMTTRLDKRLYRIYNKGTNRT
jgi:hypothetical protein